jgi:hypothetical protein
MPARCAVCAHRNRAAIDLELAAHQCNVSELARSQGVSRSALNHHRRDHLTTFLQVYGAAVNFPTLGQLHGELLRLHAAALDNLAAAERGRLVRVPLLDDDGAELFDSEGHKRYTHERRYDPSAVSRCIGEARKVVDRITMLAADAGKADERPTGMVAGELGARIAEQLARLDERRVLPGPTQDDPGRDTSDETKPPRAAPLALPVGAGADPPSELVSGGLSVSGGLPCPPQVSNDAGTPSEIQALSDATRTALRGLEDSTSTTTSPRNRQVILSIPNPRWDGSPAASPEERTQAGFPDIELTLEDLRARPDLLAQLVPVQLD